ncbi:hypothetical protein M408DRAFT_331962 [Serendipita vermifera MAFF 305830]|uniref:Uncharacterized protein n=1 Tax=Serendipita vermifera MAFF 305830 TaxID=933852 RepID=A0A0C3AHA9_SERVB|nr:hypothetical protein M408DRAFT_331962 [Serendipita vermifera MAFF 305830]
MNSPFSKDAQIITKHGDNCVLTHETLDISNILATVSSDDAGAIATFIGQTRNNFQGKVVTHLEYSAYSDLAIKTMSDIVADARARSSSPLSRIGLYHRLGSCPVGQTSIVVAVASPHRVEAFEACSFIVNEVKGRAQVFKMECYDGDQPSWKAN